MAFRTQTKTCACVIFLAAAACAQSYPVRHKHLRNGVTGTLRVDENAITFTEPGKQAKHSRVWKYDDIQELLLGAGTLRIVTYEDNRREFGRDRVFDFDHLPASVVAAWYPVYRRRLDARFVAALADPAVQPEWQLPAKLARGTGGSQGMLLVARDLVVYKTAVSSESRSWRIADLENISSSGPFDLTITTHERGFRFQLKHALEEGRYQELWLRINETHGLRILSRPGGPTLLE